MSDGDLFGTIKERKAELSRLLQRIPLGYPTWNHQDSVGFKKEAEKVRRLVSNGRSTSEAVSGALVSFSRWYK